MQNLPAVDIGKNRWQGIWVSKSDLVEFLRCKYRVYLAYIRGIPIGELKDNEAVRAIIERGRQFESSVISQMPFEEVEEGERVESLLSEEIILRTPQLIRNHELGLQGIPDLISVAKGKLYPIEIKLHKEVRWSDELELAFYWELLEPLRKRKLKPKPKGYILLNTGEIAEVSLTNYHFQSLSALVEQVREVKTSGAEPAISSECKLCTLRDECHRLVFDRGGLSPHSWNCTGKARAAGELRHNQYK